jgi:hypothetical protein
MNPSPEPIPAPTFPTVDQRQQLVRAMQQQSLKHADPLAANIGIITGDILMLAHALGDGLWPQLSEPAADGSPRALHSIELYLRCTRTLDRYAQRVQKLVAATPPSEQIIGRTPKTRF